MVGSNKMTPKPTRPLNSSLLLPHVPKRDKTTVCIKGAKLISSHPAAGSLVLLQHNTATCCILQRIREPAVMQLKVLGELPIQNE